jgi:Ca2+-binding EF-hand superfamily protein
VSLPNAKLEVFAMDSFTKSYLSGDFKRGTNLKQVFEKLRKKIVETRVNLREVYLMLDQDRNGRVDQKEFLLIIDRAIGMGILSPEEVLVLFKKFDQRGTGSISWADFVDTMENKDAWGATPSLTDMDDTEVDKYVSSLWASSENDKEQLQLERAMKVIQTFGEQLGLMAATKLFREFDLDHNGTIELSEFRSVLVESLFMAEKDVDLVVKKVWPADPVNYENFFKVVNQFEAYKQTGRSIAKDSDHVMTSPKVAPPKRINDLLAQPLGSNNLKRVLIVEQEPAPGTTDPSFSKNGHRYDTVPLANGE